MDGAPTRIAITGGTGFIGRHLAERYPTDRVVVVSRRTGVAVDDVDALTDAFEGCDVVAHLAGINREIGAQTYRTVHVDGTAAVVEAAKRAGVRKILLLSFLRARPGTASGYHESKWIAEELVRDSGLDHTILKAGMVYGHGDHLVDHLSHVVQTIPLFATVGFRDQPIRPVPVGELVDVLVAAAAGRMTRKTVAVVGAETLTTGKAVRRVAAVVGKPVVVLPAPVWALTLLGRLTEATMHVPLVAVAQVRMLAEGVAEAAPPTPPPPADLRPRQPFDRGAIRAALPPPGGFRLSDLRLPGRRAAR